jgi:hypothetical protein
MLIEIKRTGSDLEDALRQFKSYMSHCPESVIQAPPLVWQCRLCSEKIHNLLYCLPLTSHLTLFSAFGESPNVKKNCNVLRLSFNRERKH